MSQPLHCDVCGDPDPRFTLADLESGQVQIFCASDYIGFSLQLVISSVEPAAIVEALQVSLGDGDEPPGDEVEASEPPAPGPSTASPEAPSRRRRGRQAPPAPAEEREEAE